MSKIGGSAGAEHHPSTPPVRPCRSTRDGLSFLRSATVHRWHTDGSVRLQIERIGRIWRIKEGLLGGLGRSSGSNPNRTVSVKIKILGSVSIRNVPRVSKRTDRFGRIERIRQPAGQPYVRVCSRTPSIT